MDDNDFVRVNQLMRSNTPSARGQTPASIFSGAMGTPASTSIRPIEPPSPAPSVISSSSTLSNRTTTADKNLTLDQFARRYTSEDNASFEKMQLREAQAIKQRYALVFEAETSHNQFMLEHLPKEKAGQLPQCPSTIPLLLTNTPTTSTPEQAAPSSPDPNNKQIVPVTAESLPIPTPPPSTPEALIKAKPTDERVTPLGWKFTTMNELMFGPQVDVPYRIEEFHKGPEREIKHANTRLVTSSSLEPSAKPSPSNFTYTEIGGPSTFKRGPDRFDLDDMLKSPAHPSLSNPYPILGTPSPSPSQLGNQSPFMTWGEIEGTPLRIEEEDIPYTGVPVFALAEPSKREKKAMDLSSAAQARIRKREQTESPMTFSGTYSPAAKRLLKAINSPLVHKTTKSTADVQLRRTYSSFASPSPMRSPAPSLSHVSRRVKPTPSPITAAGSRESSSVTDNLLNI
eukprot:c2269_g1_i1.p1 GENE.c2269_g1_i1~~c2269_g1_i1.p1  ORF type:complete len:514 (-),score=107.45 c2269_g1_i1:106-1473(-)